MVPTMLSCFSDVGCKDNITGLVRLCFGDFWTFFRIYLCPVSPFV